MEQQANYIRRIEIHGLWERFNIGVPIVRVSRYDGYNWLVVP